ncbi:MAG TPA: tetratricopeptide repeat protein [Casimicrobiaceae bacterium]|jgi:SAM-dependent methyltransferase/Flp pilus assembly protein TadD|nr:tetratricopeptide repeat protein [Casimicrobiaceae bacterium]
MFRSRDPFKPESSSNQRPAQELVDRGIAAETSGSPMEALHCYRAAIELDPECAVAHYNLGMAHVNLKDYPNAEGSLRTALRFRSPFPEASVGLATALEGLGHDEEALTVLERAIAERGDYAGALIKAGLLAKKLRRVDAAIAYERRALEVEPEHYLVHLRLGQTLHSLGRFSEAEASFRAALTLNPGLTEALLDLASALQAQGRNPEALQFLFDAVARHPDSLPARHALVSGLVDVRLPSAGEKIREIILSLCRDDKVSVRLLSVPLIALFEGTGAFRQLQNSTESGEDPFARPDFTLRAFLRDPLLLAALPRIQVLDPALEKVLTHLRRCILLGSIVQRTDESAVPLDFVCALAAQCFFSSYAFFAADDELERVATLRRNVEAALRGSAMDTGTLEPLLLMIAMYGYLDTLVGSERLLKQNGTGWSPAFQSILEEQIEHRQREREIAEHLLTLTVINDAVSQAVRDQYEQHPYPVWAGGVQHLPPDTFEELWLRLCPNQPVRFHARPVPMLVAGCGTGENLILLARRYPECAILAVDLSLASLAYAARMSEQCRVSSVNFAQADILKLGDLDRRFAIIDCAGVLHHLRDPMEGWRVLVDLLEPDGLMRIALYSAKGRKEIQPAREFAASLGLPRTSNGVRRCRSAILALPNGHPAKEVVTSGDFFTLNGCRDLLMHVQEHQFTLPQIADCLDRLGLRFLAMQCASETRRRFAEMFGNQAALGDLRAWDSFEARYPSAFRAMYSFWCCRKAA